MKSYDYSILKESVARYGEERFAHDLGIEKARLDHLLSGCCEFTADEIIAAAKLLSLTSADVKTHFFKTDKAL